jgi:hypothetical protein
MSWWRRNWRWVLGCGVVGFGILAFIALYLLRKKEEAEQLRAQLALMQASNKVEGLRADRKARKIELMMNAKEAKQLEKEIAAAKRETVAIVKDVEKLSDWEVSEEFRDMGY